MQKIYSCAGTIVFNSKLETILVSTKKGNHSFPKGKHEKGETFIQNAIRETEEETGLKPEMLKYAKNTIVKEYGKSGLPTIGYLVGIISDHTYKTHKFSFDNTELANVGWYTREELHKLDGLYDKRKVLFDEAYQIASSNPEWLEFTEFTKTLS